MSIPKKELEAEVGVFAGWGRGAAYLETAWDTNKQNAITSCVKSGLRRFYHPPPMGGVLYEWTFLKPVASMTFLSGQSVMDMPDDFANLSGQITVTSDGQSFVPVHLAGAGRLSNEHAAFPTATGRPEIAAIRFKKQLNEIHGQRQELQIYPTAAADYTIQFQYELLPNALNGEGAYAYGGMVHAETIKAACKAAYELDFDDIKGGPQDQYFMERLAASIAQDRKSKPQFYGYNGDASDGRYYGRPFQMDRLVTIGGASPL